LFMRIFLQSCESAYILAFVLSVVEEPENKRDVAKKGLAKSEAWLSEIEGEEEGGS